MQKTRVAITLGLLSGLLSAPALAQPGSPGPGPATAPSSPDPRVEHQASDDVGFAGATTDRWSTARLLLGADVVLSSIDGFDDSNGSSQRLELYGQYMAATNAGGVGVYGSLPVSRVSIDGDSESEIGNPEFGGLYAPRIAGAELVLRAGISPSLHDENDNGGFVNLLSSFGRLTDFIAQAPGTTMLRLSGSPMLRSGNIVARADLGFDIPLSSDGGLDADAVARFNLAIGADLGQLVVAGELVNLVNLGGDGDSEFLHTLGMSGHLKLGTVQPFASLVIPLDESLRDLIDFALAFGVRFTPT